MKRFPPFRLLWRSLWRDRRGNVAIIFGLAALPLVSAMGVAVDYSRAANVQENLQAAADVAALAASSKAASQVDEEELLGFARNILVANFKSQGAEVTDVRLVMGEKELTVEASAALPTSFAGIMGIEDMDIAALSTAVWGGNPIELALVLDNTGSMEGIKMRTLKEASRAMLSIIEEAVPDNEPESARVAIVPFTTQVRVSLEHEGADWLIPLDEHDPRGRGDADPKCRDIFRNFYWYFYQGGREICSRVVWQGCIGERGAPHDVDDSPVLGMRDSRGYPAESCENDSLAEIMPLTGDFEALDRRIGEMYPVGATNVTIGVAWGMAALSRQEPLTEATEPGEIDGLQKVMVVLTDGDNSQRHHDERTRKACENAKATGIRIFTIRVMDGNRDLIRECASDPSHYFDVENISDLLPAFREIGTQVSRLRLAR